jgi:acyl carrier protein
LNKSNLPKLTSLRHIFCSGEALKPEFVKQHHALLSCPLHNLYGPTEASVDVSYYQTTPQDTVVPIGKPVDNTQLYVLDKNLRPVGIGIAGDLYIGGIQLAKGYLHKENITAERFISNPFQPEAKLYKTGDVARWLPDGNLEYLGRSDFQVKIRGFRIEVGEIENALLRCEDIKDAVVMARTDQANSLYLVAYLTSDLAIQSNELRDFLKQRLPEYMVPAYFVRLPEIPLNANGKADRKVLPAPEGLGLDSGSVYVAPRNSLQKRLVRIWEEVLGSSLVGIASNFFELGGHSLKATQIVARIHKELDVKVELRAIFQHPTIESLASIITATGKTTFQAIEPVTPQAYYELSNTQRRIWILNQFEADQMAYNMPGGYLFKGNLNVEALEKAFAALLERHESLRTTFVLVEGQPYQKIHNSASFRFEIEKIDLSGDPVALQNVKVLADAEAETPFDLETGPLLRAILIRVAADEHIFLFTMHHIISDGWSMGVLIQNITQLYNAFSQDKGNPLGPLRIQYKDYVAWQNQAVSGESADRYKTFWKSQFNEKSPVLALPTDKKRPVVRSTQGNRVTFVLNQAITQPLKERGEQHGCTPFLTLLGVYNLFLYYYTRQTDLVVGTPVAGREHADLEDQIGLYLNMIPLRCKLDPEYTFGQLLEATCQTATQSFNYQLYPFDKLVEDLEITSEPNRHPLFDVVIDSLDFDSTAKEVQLDQVQVLDYKTEQLASKYDLILYFQETAEGFQIAFEYSTDLFEHATVTRMARRFQILTETLLKKPEATLAELCLDDKPAFARIGTARREIVG